MSVRTKKNRTTWHRLDWGHLKFGHLQKKQEGVSSNLEEHSVNVFVHENPGSFHLVACSIQKKRRQKTWAERAIPTGSIPWIPQY
jgi:hypothetical protein